ncbi:MAG: hypothetical protein R3A45_01495 [Bdellovibrionota bacterium]
MNAFVTHGWIGIGHHNKNIAVGAMRDEIFGTVDHPTVTFFLSRGFHAGSVTTRTWFG